MSTLSPEVRQVARDAERAFLDWAEEEGWEVNRNGWPDFLCVDRKGRVVCIEAKSGNASLTKAQRRVMAILASCGLKCYTWSPGPGLVPFLERRAGLRAEGFVPPQTFAKPPRGLPRRLWEVAGVGTKPI